MKKRYELKNLSCADCAVELENSIKKIKGVESASVNFANSSLIISHSQDEAEILEKLKETAKQHDNAQVLERGERSGHEHNGNIRADIIRLALSAALLLTSLFLKGNLKIVILLLSYLAAAQGVLFNAAKNIARGKVFDENFLMSIASLGAIAIGKYTEAVEVMIFYGIGEIFQAVAVGRSRKSIAKLMDLQPSFARVVKDGAEIIVKPQDIEKGDIMLVKAGEKVAADSLIIKGESSFDLRSLTGESLPSELVVGQQVLGGGINLSAVVTLEAIKPYSQSQAAKIAELIENSAARKAAQENFITKFARVYTPIVCLLALIVAIFVPLFDGFNFAKWIYRALIFLVVSCPCALVLSVPLSFFSGIGMSARSGILVKGGNYLENLGSAKIAVFDKTGTLTDGNFTVWKVLPEKEQPDFIKYAAALSKNSNHPLSQAVAKEFASALIAENVREIAGGGVIGTVGGKAVITGSLRFLQSQGVEVKECEEIGAKIYTAVGGKYSGCIIIRDNLRKSAGQVVAQLKKLGIKKTVMLTGDNEEYAAQAAKNLNIDEYYSKLLPEDKVEKVKQLEKSGKVFFVGDGINDAPVLTVADAGISMGGVGSDAAVEASDIVIINDDLLKIPIGIKIARRTMKIVKQNIIFAIGVKTAVMILSVFGLASMQMAVFADVGVMVLSILNSMRNFLRIA